MSKKIPKTVKGDIVEVHFVDHAEDYGKSFEFIVWGRVAEVVAGYIVLESWTYEDERDREGPDDENVKRFVIVRSTISRLVKLRR